MKKRSTEATRRTRETKAAGGIKGADSAPSGAARSLTIGLALLSPVKHRDEEVAQDLAVLRARDLLVRTRVKLIGHARGAVKSAGHRLKASSTSRSVR